MILKKPYAFLIKHFRLIHLLLLPPIIYLIYQSSKIVTFFNNYAKTGTYTYVNDLAGSYINPLMYLAIIFILLIVLVVTYLLFIKKKPIKLYIGFIAYYTILLIIFTVVHNILGGIEDELLEMTTIRAYRDFSLIFYVPQYFFLVYDFIRAFGFDIKSFNFSHDLKELEIEASDSEEVEIKLDINNYQTKRKLNRYIREMKYYAIENRFIITCIGVIALIIVGIIGYYNYSMYHKTYKEMQIVNNNGFQYAINKSLITNLDYKGEKLSDNKYYLVISIDINNMLYSSNKLDKKDFTLEINEEYYYPVYDRGDYFLDYGIPYKGEKIKGSTKKTYVLVYELDKKLLYQEYNMVIMNEFLVKKNDLIATKKYIRIKPDYAINNNKVTEVGLGKEVKFNDTNLDGSSLKINKYEILSYYTYKSDDASHIVVPDTQKYGNGVLLVLSDELKINTKSNYYSSMIDKKTFYNNHAIIACENNGIVKYFNAVNITPNDVKDVSILQVNRLVNDSEHVKLIISIRGVMYYIDLV